MISLLHRDDGPGDIDLSWMAFHEETKLEAEVVCVATDSNVVDPEEEAVVVMRGIAYQEKLVTVVVELKIVHPHVQAKGDTEDIGVHIIGWKSQ